MKAGIALLALVATPMLADDLAEVFARMDKTAPGFKALSADIKEDDFNALVKIDRIQNGSIKLRRAKSDTSMLIDFTGENAQTVSLEGTQVRVYYPKLALVQAYDVSGKRGLIDQFLLLGFGASSTEIKAAYDVSYVGAESIGGQPSGHIKLIPKSPDVLKQLKQAELWISSSSGLPVQQKFVTTGSGDFKLVTYSNIKANPSLSSKDLQLKTPKGVRTEQMNK